MKVFCQCGCGRKVLIRKSDIKKGWGKYFSKECRMIVELKSNEIFKKFFPHQDIINNLKAKGY